MAKRWRGRLYTEGVESGDGRMIAVGATTWRELPIDYRAVFIDGFGGHANAECIGTIESIEVRGAEVWGDGPLLYAADGMTLLENADKWATMNAQGAMRGVSVDLTGGSVKVEIVDAETGDVLPDEVPIDILWGPDGDKYRVREVWTAAEIGAATSVSTQAFSNALVEVYDTEDVVVETSVEAEPVLAASGAATFATVDEVEVGDEVTWMEGDPETEHTGTVTAIDAEAETVDVSEEVMPGEHETHTLPVADVTVVEDDEDAPESAAASRFPALAAQVPAPAQRPALAALLARERGEEVVAASGHPFDGAVLTASVAWDGGPPRDAFQRVATGVTPWTVEDDGTVHGHLCLWGQCHTGFAGAVLEHCLMPNASPSNYSLFHASGRVRCDDGTRLPVGIISMDTGHAPSGQPGARPSASSVRAHYDNTGTQAMFVRVVDDEWGAYACGVIAPGVSVDDVRRAMAAKPSGDWRNYGDGLDLMGVLMVNVPGYPVYEVEDSQVMSLVASLSPPADFTPRPPAAAGPAPALASSLAFPEGTPLADVEAAVAALRSDGCGCQGACGSCSGGAHEHAAHGAAFPGLRLRALDHAMS